MGAALAYYTIFSLAPLLLLVIAVAGLVFGVEAARGQIVGQLAGLIGEEGAVAIQGLLKSASVPTDSIWASLVGLATLVLGATSVFAELQSSLDRIWRVPTAPGAGFISLVRGRLLSFGLIVSVGFLLLVSLVISAGLAALAVVGPVAFVWETVLQTSTSWSALRSHRALRLDLSDPSTCPGCVEHVVWIGSPSAILFTAGTAIAPICAGSLGRCGRLGRRPIGLAPHSADLWLGAGSPGSFARARLAARRKPLALPDTPFPGFRGATRQRGRGLAAKRVGRPRNKLPTASIRGPADVDRDTRRASGVEHRLESRVPDDLVARYEDRA
jgi:hypothetical protein